MRGSVYSKDAYEESSSLGFSVVTMSAVREMGLQRLIEIIKGRVGRNMVFVSFDITDIHLDSVHHYCLSAYKR